MVIEGRARIVELFDTVESDYYGWSWRDQLIRTCPFFILIYDITSRESFEALSNWIDRILRVKVSFPSSHSS